MGYEAIPVQSQPEDLFCNRSMVRLSGICLRQIDPLPRPKNNALCGLVWMYPRHRDLGRAGGIALGSRQKRKLIEVSVRFWFPLTHGQAPSV